MIRKLLFHWIAKNDLCAMFVVARLSPMFVLGGTKVDRDKYEKRRGKDKLNVSRDAPVGVQRL